MWSVIRDKMNGTVTIRRLSNRRILFFALFLIAGTLLRAQTYYFDNYSVADGLAQSSVYAIIQDQNDYIWMGTEGGVTRFDGINFENYTTEDGLALNGVRALFEDSHGNIWMGHTGGGVTRFDGKNFEILPHSDFVLFKSDVTSIIEDKEGYLWITTSASGTVSIWNSGAPIDEIKYEEYSGKRLSDRVFYSVQTRDSSLFFITDIGIKKYDRENNDFVNFNLEKLPMYFQITSMIEDAKGDLWFGTYNGGLYRYDVSMDSVFIYDVRDGLTSNFISTLASDSKGNIWVGTWQRGNWTGGIVRFSPDGNMKAFYPGNGLQDGKIRAIMEDAEGNILIGTNEHGLSIFKGEAFITFLEQDGLVDKQVFTVMQDSRDRYWFGTNGGISVYNPELPEGEQFRHFTSDDYAISNQIRYLEEDRQGHIWIGTNGGGTFEYVPPTNKFRFSFVLNSYNRQLITTAMEIDDDNVLWVGTTEGLTRYDINTGQTTFLTQGDGITGNDISVIYSDSKGRVWVGARSEGLAWIRDELIQRTDIKANFTPTSLAEDHEGKIWIGTEGQGILVYDGDSIVNQYTVRDGLLANLITLIEVDENNNIYIGTNKGLNKLMREEDKIYTYTQKNGFVGIETKNNASLLDKEGNVWFGTVNGVTRYDPDKVKTDRVEPLTHITRLRVNLEERPLEEGLELNYKENSVIFDYTSICLTNPEAVRYRIMLEGADQEWQPETEQTTAAYPALPPNKYVFKLTARNAEGMWNSEPITFAFRIKPPFYQTWWFILICVVAGGLAIFAYIKIRERALRRENKILEEKVAERTAEVVAQKEELAEKNKDITDSIHYAKRIQFAILPPDIPFENTFILFKPKDIVSGDFYWILKDDHMEYIAAVDCTGHGVPGAFMSIIGHNSLNKIVKEYNILEPGKIMEQLDAEVVKTLHSQGEGGDVKDGMDMSLICYNRKTRELQYAGAMNNMYMIRNGYELEEIKADRFAIGRGSVVEEKKFTTHKFKIQGDETIYLFSDGYADQFGGELGKKFKSKPFKELLMNIQDKSMEEQSTLLNATIEAWRGNYEQVDDILVIGRRFPGSS